MDLSIVIPVYNSATTLEQLVQRLFRVLDGTGLSYEVILVNDGSSDNSWETLTRFRRECPDRLVAIQLMRNFGQHNALMCGFRHSRGKYVITMDDDLQNPPEEIPKLIAAIDSGGLDLVYGSFESKKHNGWRNLGSTLIRLFYVTVFKKPVMLTSFRVIRRELLTSIFPYNLNFTYIDGLLAWNTQRIGSVLVEHRARASGRSGYSLPKLVLLAFNLFTNFSLLPLQLVSASGFFVALMGLLTGFYYLAQYMFSSIAVPGYASTIIAVLVLGGTQLLALGVMGEYLGRLHLNVNRKPQYVERQVLAPETLPLQANAEDSGRDATDRRLYNTLI